MQARVGARLSPTMRPRTHLSFFATFSISVLSSALPSAPSPQISTQSYTWKNVKIGGGGGFVPGIVFNPSQKGLAYARTDIGGVYKLNADDSWTPLVDFADNARWDYWGSDALATDPVDPNRLYIVSHRRHGCSTLEFKHMIGCWNVHEFMGPEQRDDFEFYGSRKDFHREPFAVQGWGQHAGPRCRRGAIVDTTPAM